MKRWWRNRRFLASYNYLKKIADRHRKQGHSVEFEVVNESFMVLICRTCQYGVVDA